MSTWFVSDHHFSHANIISFCDRPFDSVKDMNEALVTYHNELVAQDDIVYFLGDLAMGQLMDSLPIVKKMHGVKWLVPGNHDRMHSTYRSKQDIKYWTDVYLKEADVRATDEVIWHYRDSHNLAFRPSHNTALRLSHLPPIDHPNWADDTRFRNVAPAEIERVTLHGHTHQTDIGDGHNIHVGVDARNYRPVHIDQVYEEARWEVQ